MANALPSFPEFNPNTAGIDIGSEEIFVAVFNHPVKRFATDTGQLHQAAEYLKQHGVNSVAIEATGVLWIPLYEIIEQHGIEPYLVNGAHARSLQRPKSDVADCQWLLDLHSRGMLRKCFVPPEDIRGLRAYMRLRDDHIEMGAMHVQHMRKALELMNLKLGSVIDELHGVSGMRVLKAIVAGERDANVLLELCDRRIVRSKGEKVLAALQGHYKPEYIFALQQAIDCYEFYQRKIAECDRAVADLLQRMTDGLAPGTPKSPTKSIRRHGMDIPDLHVMLVTLCRGADPQQMAGVSTVALLRLLGEVGTDMSAWRAPKQFTAWLGLAMRKASSGKRNYRNRRRPKTRAGQIFRELALSVSKTRTGLGAFYRRIKARSGPRIALVALARKLAERFYRLMRYGNEYLEQHEAEYEAQYQQRRLRSLERAAESIGMRLVPA